LFSLHRGDVVLPVEVTGQPPATSKQPGLYVSASRALKSGEIILKVVNNAAEPITSGVQIEGAQKIASTGTMVLLTGKTLTDENSIAGPKKVAPVTSSLKNASAAFPHTFRPYSLTVLRLKARD